MKYVVKKSKMVPGRFKTSRPEIRVWVNGLAYSTMEEAVEAADKFRAEEGPEWTVWATEAD